MSSPDITSNGRPGPSTELYIAGVPPGYFGKRSAARAGEIGGFAADSSFFRHQAPNNKTLATHTDYPISDGHNGSSVKDYARVHNHIKSSQHRDTFYQEAMNSQHWVVSEVQTLSSRLTLKLALCV